jgi:hypothetical protein
MEVAFAIAEDFVALGVAGEDLAADFGGGEAGGEDAAEERVFRFFDEAGGERVRVIFDVFPDQGAEAPWGGEEGHVMACVRGGLREICGIEEDRAVGEQSGNFSAGFCNDHGLSPFGLRCGKFLGAFLVR